MAFLNEHGLETFLAYVKAWARATFVNATGDQTVSGTKTFSSPIVGSLNGTASNASKVNNHTVNSDVPAGAVFTDTTYSNATTSFAGLMSAADKVKLNGVVRITTTQINQLF